MLATLAVSACARPIPRHLSRADTTACFKRGGHVEGVCMFGTPACVIPYSDGGKACHGRADCQGECRLYESEMAGLKIGDPAVGKCQASSRPCGCWSQIEGGRVKFGLCED